KPTRFPYSCQAQFGTSGEGDPPAGGVKTVRGIGSAGFHSSTLIMIQTTRRAPPGKVSFGRSLIAEYGIRSLSIIDFCSCCHAAVVVPSTTGWMLGVPVPT